MANASKSTSGFVGAALIWLLVPVFFLVRVSASNNYPLPFGISADQVMMFLMIACVPYFLWSISGLFAPQPRVRATNLTDDAIGQPNANAFAAAQKRSDTVPPVTYHAEPAYLLALTAGVIIYSVAQWGLPASLSQATVAQWLPMASLPVWLVIVPLAVFVIVAAAVRRSVRPPGFGARLGLGLLTVVIMAILMIINLETWHFEPQRLTLPYAATLVIAIAVIALWPSRR